MVYFTEFTTVLLMLMACIRLGQALLGNRILVVTVNMFAAGFYGTVAMIGVRVINGGVWA